MEMKTAVAVLSALAQETRLRVFRLLIENAPDGLPATEIAARIGVRQNLMSNHLAILSNTGVTTTRRDGRRIFHAVDLRMARALIDFLLQDCCRASPEECAALVDEIAPLLRADGAFRQDG